MKILRVFSFSEIIPFKSVLEFILSMIKYCTLIYCDFFLIVIFLLINNNLEKSSLQICRYFLFHTLFRITSHLRGKMQRKMERETSRTCCDALGASYTISISRKRERLFLKTSELRTAVFAQQFHSRQPWPIALPQQRSRIIEIQSRGISMRYRKNRRCTFSGTKQCTCRVLAGKTVRVISNIAAKAVEMLSPVFRHDAKNLFS